MPDCTTYPTTARSWVRLPVTTRWLAPGDDLATELDQATAGMAAAVNG